MKLTVLGASGRTGRELVRQALERGHEVRAVVRDPAALGLVHSTRLSVVRADARAEESLARALTGGGVVLSALGVRSKDASTKNVVGLLAAGARAVLAARPQYVVWLGAFGSGGSASAAGWATRTLLSLMGARLLDKVNADQAILGDGGAVFHAGPLGMGPVSAERRTAALADVPKRWFPARVNRATVAAAMLDEAERPRFSGRIAVPLDR